MLCDPSFAAPFDHGAQAGAVDEADVHLATHVRGEQALQIFHCHAGGQRLECRVDIRPTMKSARLHKRAIDPDRRARDMPGQGGAEKITGAIGKDRIATPPPFTF